MLKDLYSLKVVHIILQSDIKAVPY